MNADVWPYTMVFENKREATASAALVEVADTLDVNVFDPESVTCGPVTIGRRTFVPPIHDSGLDSVFDLRPEQPVGVHVRATVEKETGVIKWRMAVVNPLDGRPLDDDLAGFLPPNVTAAQGEGAVKFSVSRWPHVKTGTRINNGASIVFDTNAPIETPVRNVLDTEPPTSVVSTAVFGRAGEVHVTWAGQDALSSELKYSIFVSENCGRVCRACASRSVAP